MSEAAERSLHLERLANDRDTNVIDILTTIQEAEPEYTRFESMADEDLWAGTEGWLYDVFLQLATEERTLTVTERQLIREVGTTRASQSFQFDAAQAGVHAANRVMRQRIAHEYSQSTPAARAATEGLLELLDEFTTAIESLMHEGFVQAGRPGPKTKEKALALIQDVADRRVRNSDELVRRASELGCDTSASRVLLVAADLEAAERVARALAEVYLVHRSSGRSLHSVLVVPVPASGFETTLDTVRELAAEAGTTLVVSGPWDQLDDLYDRYVCAAALVPHVRTLGTAEKVVFDRDLVVRMMAAALPRDVRQSFVRQVLDKPLASLLSQDAQRLRNHLETEVRLGFSVAAVQRHLRVKKTTVYRRRDRFFAVVGLSMTQAQDRAILTLVHHAACIEDSPPTTN